jgi:hypothetical protein
MRGNRLTLSRELDGSSWVLRAWTVLAFLVICACATTKGQGSQSSHQAVNGETPRGDQFCDGDTDCVILDVNIYEDCPCGSIEPYAVSRAALERKESETHACPDVECIDRPGHARAKDFYAICVDHTCERRTRNRCPYCKEPEPWTVPFGALPNSRPEADRQEKSG